MFCPKCHYELEVDDVYDTQGNDEWQVEFIVGHCTICSQDYQWERNFKFYNEDNLAEYT